MDGSLAPDYSNASREHVPYGATRDDMEQSYHRYGNAGVVDGAQNDDRRQGKWIDLLYRKME